MRRYEDYFRRIYIRKLDIAIARISMDGRIVSGNQRLSCAIAQTSDVPDGFSTEPAFFVARQSVPRKGH